MAFGDSLTAGKGLDDDEAYPAVLQGMLTAAGLPFSVKNHGVSGDTTADAVRRLDAALAESPGIMIVALGANDGLRGVPVAEVGRNLETIIEAAQARRHQCAALRHGALPINGWEYTLDSTGSSRRSRKRYNVPLVPFLLKGVIGNPRMVQQDQFIPARRARSRWRGRSGLISSRWPRKIAGA